MTALLDRTTAIALLAGLFATPSADEIGRTVEEDTVVLRTCVTTVDLELDEMTVTVNGEELPPELAEEFEMTSRGTYVVVVRDEYGAPGDGRPRTLERTFETTEGEVYSSMTSPDGDEEGTDPAASAVEGLSVRFTWNDPGEAYDVEYIGDEEGDEELLDLLVEDMDLRAFLPEGDVDEGDSWSVDAELFQLVNYPGGVDLVTEEGGEEYDDELDRLLDENTDGDIEATYQGTREEDGVEVAVIFVTAELSAEAEVELELEGTQVLRSASLAMELEGELLWDAASGHLHSYTLAGDVELVSGDEGSEEFEGEEFSFAQSTTLTGSIEFAAEVERE